MNGFRKYHPAVIFIYYVVMMMTTIFVFDPVLLLMYLVSQGAFYIYLKGSSSGVRFAGKSVCVIPVCALVNSLVNHRGVTVLWYVFDLPVTAECICYGCMTGTLFASSILMFGCYNEIMTSEKTFCLFANRFPKFSLILSMALRMLPKVRRDYDKLRQNHKLQTGILTTLIGLTLEDSMETGLAMRDRGYGKTGHAVQRTSIYSRRFVKRDLFFAVIVVIVATVGIGIYRVFDIHFLVFPYVEYRFQANGRVAYLLFALLCFIPLGIHTWEEIRWKRIVSKI